MSDYLSMTDFSVSWIFGKGLYSWDGDVMRDPYSSAACESPVLTNVITDEKFFVRRFTYDSALCSHLEGHVLHPPAVNNVLWPRDMVDLSQGVANNCSSFLFREYSDSAGSMKRTGELGLLFSLSDPTPTHPTKDWLSHSSERSWRSEDLRQFTYTLIKGFERLNRSGYAYTEVSFDRLFVTLLGEVFFDYSPYMFPLKDGQLEAPAKGTYPVEFAEPIVATEQQSFVDFNTQNYSLAAMIMYLLMGRYAYDGALFPQYHTDDDSDESLQDHYARFRAYHQNPWFVFDTVPNENALGIFAEDQEVIDLWESMPQEIRFLLEQTLTKDNATRVQEVFNPPPITWLDAFRAVGWTASETAER